MLDKKLIEKIASALGTRPGLIEKDWHVVRALGVLATLEHQEIKPVFSGGTSFAKEDEEISFAEASRPQKGWWLSFTVPFELI